MYVQVLKIFNITLYSVHQFNYLPTSPRTEYQITEHNTEMQVNIKFSDEIFCTTARVIKDFST